MNVPIVRLFVLVLALYAALVGFSTYWSVLDSEGLEENSANRRPLLEEQRVRRGAIRTADGKLAAGSEISRRDSQRFYERRYPQGQALGHPLGYNFIQEGRTGIEKSHNSTLVGERAEFVSILDQLRGRRQEGDDLRITIDLAAQRTALEQLAGRKGSVVAIEPSTGRVRVMASVPTFDPNRIPAELSKLNRAQGSPLLNRATQAGYQPGSTFKVITAVAAIDSGRFTPQSAVSGSSPKEVSGAPLRNFGNQSYGQVDLTTALTRSINTVWAEVGVELGAETMYRYMDRFGFNAEPELDYPDQQMRASGEFAGGRLLDAGDDRIDIGRVAIGQDKLEVTPLQMAQVAAAIANRGRLMRPRLWDRAVDPDGRVVDRMEPRAQSQVMRRETAAALTEMMSRVVREGTGTAAALEGIDVAGKTGTAEVSGGLNQAWFIAFAPVQRPRVAIAATVERTTGQGGTVAAPIAKAVMQSLVGRRGIR